MVWRTIRSIGILLGGKPLDDAITNGRRRTSGLPLGLPIIYYGEGFAVNSKIFCHSLLYRMSKWIEFVKEFASKKGMSYKSALKDAECKKEYHSSKTEGGSLAKEPALVPPPMPKKERKSPKKTVEPESPKEIREANASGQNITMEVLEGGPKPKATRKRPKKTAVEIPHIPEGEGVLQAGYTTEAVNGLEHIYPISHDMVLKIVKQLG